MSPQATRSPLGKHSVLDFQGGCSRSSFFPLNQQAKSKDNKNPFSLQVYQQCRRQMQVCSRYLLFISLDLSILVITAFRHLLSLQRAGEGRASPLVEGALLPGVEGATPGTSVKSSSLTLRAGHKAYILLVVYM